MWSMLSTLDRLITLTINADIRMLPGTPFMNMVFLTTLKLSHNSISSIENSTFASLDSLHVLDLHKNKLAILASKASKGTSRAGK